MRPLPFAHYWVWNPGSVSIHAELAPCPTQLNLLYFLAVYTSCEVTLLLTDVRRLRLYIPRCLVPECSRTELLVVVEGDARDGDHRETWPELNGGRQKRVSCVADSSFKSYNLEPKTKNKNFFCTKLPKSLSKTAKRRETVTTIHIHLDVPVAKSPLGSCNSTICPRTAPKWPAKAPKFAHWPFTASNQEHAISCAILLKTRF